jgi:Protein of unknown function (DUF2752)
VPPLPDPPPNDISPILPARYAARVAVTELPDRTLQERLGGAARVDLKEVRIVGAAMLAAAAIRPAIPFEFVPPCPLRTVTGIPCPMCGMTRGVTALVHGDFAHALLMNPASYLAVALAILLLVQWRTRRVLIPVWVVVTVLAGMWAWQLVKYATGRPL